MKILKPSLIALLIFVFSAIVSNAILFYHGNISLGVAFFFMSQFIIEGMSIIVCYYLMAAIEIHAQQENDFTLAKLKMDNNSM